MATEPPQCDDCAIRIAKEDLHHGRCLECYAKACNVARELFDIWEEHTDEELRTKYKKLCRLHHPDRGGDADTFKTISCAYACLMPEHLDEFVAMRPDEHSDHAAYALRRAEDERRAAANVQAMLRADELTAAKLEADKALAEQIKKLKGDAIIAKLAALVESKAKAKQAKLDDADKRRSEQAAARASKVKVSPKVKAKASAKASAKVPTSTTTSNVPPMAMDESDDVDQTASKEPQTASKEPQTASKEPQSASTDTPITASPGGSSSSVGVIGVWSAEATE
jgi:hypothetical protein